VLSDKQKRTIYDQFGEEGLKGGGGSASGAGAGPSAFPGGANFGGFPGGSFTFSTSGGLGNGFGGSRGFQPTDPQKIFEFVLFLPHHALIHGRY